MNKREYSIAIAVCEELIKSYLASGNECLEKDAFKLLRAKEVLVCAFDHMLEEEVINA